ncbi:hypothetical protein ALO42_101733 [Pseudomonas syringae pv. atrofaciens]|uniref:Uncharacterized protein n=3 Tax=Pseudomonas syringae group TaxID=136849 RepID=A0A3M4YNG4_9PSED|nr:Uncharacterized protein AC517_1189 [Pseudomonas syringae pv. syringae]KPW13556.1 hypothetical protein ALO42_101733 [Pseudomonas syringae pv. atrofaciens]KPX07097.1 hypothetical protein ALO75_101882 [Pseudomonas syringae pv. coryli]RML21303.1 hypothetical protein ALQ99_101242 [Pseudomonas syringae pv. lapsa]RMR90121.1 hypothetical protein ALP78_101467 [Pseudomonas coronafaciens pv. striafaciens]RMS62890.1 hypothetical protein ALP62_101520 [Pseudomonas syringae pv. aceris]RMV52880.1 hypothet
MPITAIRVQQRTQNRAKPGGYESRARIRHALRDREGREEIP